MKIANTGIIGGSVTHRRHYVTKFSLKNVLKEKNKDWSSGVSGSKGGKRLSRGVNPPFPPNYTLCWSFIVVSKYICMYSLHT